MHAVRLASLLIISFLVSGAHAQARGGGDAATVRTAIKTMFDKPGAPVDVDPVSVVKGYSVAGWTVRMGIAPMRRMAQQLPAKRHLRTEAH